MHWFFKKQFVFAVLESLQSIFVIDYKNQNKHPMLTLFTIFICT